MKTPENVADNKVVRKTPEEIKKGLMCSVTDIDGCTGCPFDKRSDDGLVWECSVDESAFAYIQQLEAELQREKDHHQYTIDAANVMKDEALKLESRLAQTERERDAAINDACTICATCKHNDYSWSKCKIGGYHHNGCNQSCDNWKWRGVCAENTKEET